MDTLKKILLIPFSSIGDIVLTSPVARILNNADVEVHFLTKKSFTSLLESNPHIHKVHTLQDDINALKSQLQKENFDAILDLHNNLRSKKVKRMLGVRSLTIHKENVKKWRMVQLKSDLQVSHIVDRYLQLLLDLGYKDDGLGLDHFVNQADEVNLATLFPEGGKTLAIGIGGTYLTKRMPIEKYANIIDNLDCNIVLLGGKGDQEMANRLVKGRSKVESGCGVYNLGQSASILSQVDLVISHDTGIMHMAAAFKKKIISIWGNTVPGFGMFPYYGNVPVQNYQSEVSKLGCRPCSKLGFDTCPKGHFKCMKEQDESIILSKIKEFLI